MFLKLFLADKILSALVGCCLVGVLVVRFSGGNVVASKEGNT